MRVAVDGFPAFEAESGTTLLVALERARLPIEAACGGFAACNTCRVRVLDDGAGLSALSPEEEPFLDREDHRLACQATLRGDVRCALDPGE